MVSKRHRLVSIRKVAGFSQERLAEVVGVERSTIQRWEHGETRPQPWARPKLARALGISDQALSELLDESTEPERSSREPGAANLELLHSTVPNPHMIVSASPVSLPAAGSFRLVRVSGPAGRVGSSDMAAIHAFRSADRHIGGGHLYATVVDYLHTDVAPRLFDGDRGNEDRSMFSAAAALTEMAGWMAHDIGRDDQARRHFGRALDMSEMGRDRQLSAQVLASMSHLAHHTHQPHEAIRFARAGEEALSDGPRNPDLEARILAMQARGFASLYKNSETAAFLGLAEKALERSYGEEPSAWVSHFDEGSLASEAARCMRQLGQLSQAQRHAERIIELRPGHRTRSRALGQLILVTVLIAQGHPEQACAVAHEVLDATESLGSYPVMQQLRDLHHLLAPYNTNTVVKDFLDCLSEALQQRVWLHQWLAKKHAD